MIQLPCLADRCQMTPKSVAGYENSGEMDPGGGMMLIVSDRVDSGRMTRWSRGV